MIVIINDKIYKTLRDSYILNYFIIFPVYEEVNSTAYRRNRFFFFLYFKFSFLKLIVAYVVLVPLIFRNHRVFNNEMPFLISPSEYL